MMCIRYPITGTECDRDTLLRCAGIRVREDDWKNLCAQAAAIDAERARQRDLDRRADLRAENESHADTCEVIAAWLGLRVALLVLAGVVSLAAADDYRWGVDEPAQWYDVNTSHHLQHGVGGLAVGGVFWAGAWACGGDRVTRVTSAITAGVVIGVGFEFVQAEQVGALVDPVDALWVVAGAGVAAVLGEVGLSACSLLITPDRVAIGYAWSY